MNTILNALPTRPALLVCSQDKDGDLAAKVDEMNIVGTAQYETLLEDFQRFLSKAVASKGDVVTGKPSGSDEMVRIHTSLLLKLSPLKASVFIRLSDNHHVKLFQQGDNFTEEDLERYLNVKDVSYMYLTKESVPLFMGQLEGELKGLLEKDPPPSSKETVPIMEDTLATIYEVVDSIGFTDEVQEVVKTNVGLSMRMLGDFPELGPVLRDFQVNRDKYIPGHSLMLAHVACAMGVAVEWYSESTFEKLVFASFLHDMTLKNQDLCAVKDIEDLEKNYAGKFSAKEIQEYKTHSKKAHSIISNLKDMPAEVDKIILQHHEHPRGTGFPDALNASYISPLSSLFIVAHDLVDFIYEFGMEAVDMEKFMIDNFEKYNTGNFKKVAKALAKVSL